jgi:PAS domain S-box-containing protein
MNTFAADIFEENKLLRGIFANSPEALCLTDFDKFSILACNRAFAAFFGLSASELLGKKVEELQVSPLSEREKDDLKEDLMRGSQPGFEARYITNEGKDILAYCEAVRVEAENNHLVLFRISNASAYSDAQNTLRTIFAGTANVTGKDYFDRITRIITEVFDCKFAFVGRVLPDSLHVETLMLKVNGEVVPNFSYELKGTPCANVLNQNIAYYPNDVDFLFPEDTLLTEMGVKGYIGAAAYDENNVPIGLIVGLSDKPMKDVPNGNYIFSVFASRVAAELGRLRFQESLIEANEKLQLSKEELQLQTEELQCLNEFLEKANDELIQKTETVSVQHRNITDSIAYAQNIQNAILPSLAEFKKHFSDIFVYFRPKDVVSGDFYWFHHSQGKSIVAVADCTGHGVPGAFMSMLSYALLNEIIIQNAIFSPAEALFELNKKMRKSLRQEQNTNSDGLDIALAVIENQDDEFLITYAGAKRNSFLYDGENLTELKANRFSIGGGNLEKIFTNHHATVRAGTMFYMLSDGILDLFDKEGNRFGSRRLKNNILKIGNLSMEEQKKFMQSEVDNSDGLIRDDILVLGLKF